MRNLGKTIDQIIKIDPNLEKSLSRIKTKWERTPDKAKNYWQELINYLNSDNLLKHPNRFDIKNILNPSRPVRKSLYTFELLKPTDKILGVIPENIADIIRRHDRAAITAAKMRIEANLTGDLDLLTITARKEAKLEINSKKIMILLKDCFKLWDFSMPFTIKAKDGLLYMVEIVPLLPGDQNLVKMDPNTFKSFLRFLGIDGSDKE